MAFDALQYIASYDDLIRAFGTDTNAATQHYLFFGQFEGRAQDDFDERQYLANYPDLQLAFGSDGEQATRQYITNGFFEGRTDAIPSLPIDFDGLQYIASYPDLIAAFGPDPVAGRQHYISQGQSEGRSADDFDEQQYLANYPDLAAAFNGNAAAATLHYIVAGSGEGRTDLPLPVATDDSFTVTEDSGPARFTVLANDLGTVATPGDPLTLLAVDTTGASGSVDVTVSGRIIYEPGGAFDSLAVGQTAIDTFSYTVENSFGVTDTAAVAVTITGVNDAPVAANDAFSINEDAGPIQFQVLANDTDIDNGTLLTVLSVTGTTGTVSVGADGGGVIYDPGAFDPADGETATDSFSYVVSDGQGGQSTATVTMTILGVPEITATDFLS